MATRLFPGHKPSFRKFQFKPLLFTNDWQRPTDGDPTRPGEYGKAAESVHLKTSLHNLPELRGRCSSSVAQPSDRSVALSSACSRSPSRKRHDNDKLTLISSEKLIKQAELFRAQADAEVYRAAHMFDGELFKKIGVAMITILGSKITDKDLLDIMTQWDHNGNNKLAVTDFRMGIRNAPPFGFGVECDHKDLDKVFQVLDTEGNGYLVVESITGTLVKLHEKSKAQIVEQDAVLALAERLRVRGKKAFELA